MRKKSTAQFTPKAKRVRFDLYSPQAQKVTVAGNFNGWDVNSLPMKKDAKGIWKVSVPLEPGRYEYRFWVDGEWADDPDAQERVENPFGSLNCLKVVS